MPAGAEAGAGAGAATGLVADGGGGRGQVGGGHDDGHDLRFGAVVVVLVDTSEEVDALASSGARLVVTAAPTARTETAVAAAAARAVRRSMAARYERPC